MADRSLILGAAALGKSQGFQDFGPMVAERINAGMKMGALVGAQKRAQKNAIKAKVAGYIDQLDNNVDISELTPSQQGAVTNFLVNQRNVYADAANRIAKLDDPTSQEYLDLRDTLNGVNMSLKNLANQINSFKEDKANYLKDFEGNRLSDGNEIGNLNKAADMYTGDAYFGINQGGGLQFYDDGKEEYVSYSTAPKPFLKDFGSADVLLQLNENVYNSGRALTGARKNMVRQKVNNLLTKGGRNTLLSMATDDFIIDGGLGIQDESLFLPENEDLLRQAVLDSYMNILSDTAIQGANEKRPARGRGSGGFSGALQDEINLSAPVVNDAFKFSQVFSVNVKPEMREDKSLLLVNELNAIDPTKRGNYISRGQLYDMYLRGFEPEDNYELDDDEETRAEFAKKYGDSQVYLFNEKEPALTSPVMVNTDNPQDLYEFYLKNTGLSEKARNYYLGQYNSYINSINANNQTNESSQNTGGGSTSKYNTK